VSEDKAGTDYVRELCARFREFAEQTEFQAVREKLLALADDLEPLAKKLYFKTQKGTEDTRELVEEMKELEGKLNACEEAGAAESMCIPFYEKLEKIIHHVKTMKVRMT
jgi:hypothetical protein